MCVSNVWLERSYHCFYMLCAPPKVMSLAGALGQAGCDSFFVSQQVSSTAPISVLPT